MKPVLPRMVLTLLLSLLMALAGVQGVLACGPSQGVTSLVICGHDGAETIWLDAKGQPVSDDHVHCPKCLGTPAMNWPTPPAIPAFAAGPFARIAPVAVAPLRPFDPAQPFQARGPPPAA